MKTLFQQFCKLNWLEKLISLVVLIQIVLVFLAIANRINYPFALEWIEEGAIGHILRILSNQSIYATPSIKFIPFIYTPLYFYLSAFVTTLFDSPLLAARIVSVMSTIVVAFVVFKFIHRATRQNFYALLGVGIFTSIYGLSGTFFDLAHVDMLFNATLFTGLYLICSPSPSFKTDLLGMIFLYLSFMTKQVALIELGFAFMYLLLLRKPNRTVLLVLTTSFAIIFSTEILNWITGGWFWYYIQLPNNDLTTTTALSTFWSDDLLANLPIPILATTCLLAVMIFKNRFRPLFPFVVLATGLVFISWLSRVHTGGYTNVLIPVYTLLAVTTPIAIEKIKQLETAKYHKAKRLYPIALASLSLNLIFLTHLPQTYQPNGQVGDNNHTIESTISTLNHPIWFVSHPYLTQLANKDVYFAGNAGWDIHRSGNTTTRNYLTQVIDVTLSSQFFGTIIIDAKMPFEDHPLMYPLQERVEQYYQLADTLPIESSLYPVGWPTHPKYIYIPKP